MSFGGDKNVIYSCPIDPSHKIRGDRYLNHTTRCARKRNVQQDVEVVPGKALPAPVDRQKICFSTKGEKERESKRALDDFKREHPEAVAKSQMHYKDTDAGTSGKQNKEQEFRPLCTSSDAGGDEDKKSVWGDDYGGFPN